MVPRVRPDAFGDMLKAARLEKNLALRELERAAGLSNSFLSQLENHQTALSFESAIVLSEVLGLDLMQMAELYMHCRATRG